MPPQVQQQDRFGVVASLVVGYVYIAGVIAVLIAAAAVVAYVMRGFGARIILIIGAIVLGVVRSLVHRITPPTGVTIERHDAPVLFETLDRLQVSLRAPPMHRVSVSGVLNASV